MGVSATKWLAASVAAAALTLSLGTANARDPHYDVPRGLLSSAADELSTLHVDCEPGAYPAPKVGRKITCRFVQMLISRPSPKQTEKRLKETKAYFKTTKARKSFAAMVSAGCAKSERKLPPQMAPAEKRYWRKLWKACDEKSFDGFRKAELWKIKKVDAKTCRIQPFSFSYVFTQQDKDTWVSSQTMTTGCKHTLTLTLWRKPGDTIFWNFRQVRSVPPNAKSKLVPGSCKSMAKNPVMDYGWQRTVRTAECRYINL